MSDEKEKRMVESYEITQGVRIGDKEVVFGVDEKAEMPYLCAFYSSNGILESYQECMVGDDYAEIMELFADRVKAQCVKVHGEQEKVDVPREKITADRCIPTFRCGDIVGKVMAVKPEAFCGTPANLSDWRERCEGAFIWECLLLYHPLFRRA